MQCHPIPKIKKKTLTTPLTQNKEEKTHFPHPLPKKKILDL
jgi:hypothetical protein